jgi:hypothetical protein
MAQAMETDMTSSPPVTPKGPAGSPTTGDATGADPAHKTADQAIDDHEMIDMKLVLMDSAELATRVANVAADAGVDLRVASNKLTMSYEQQRKLLMLLIAVFGGLMIVACGVFATMAWRLQSRVTQLDTMVLAVGKRVVGMDASMESVGAVQQALQELLVKQEAMTSLQSKIDTRLEEAIKSTQGVPELTAKQIDGKTQEMSKQVQLLDGKLQAQANVLKTLSGQMKGLQGSVTDASGLRRELEAQQRQQRERQAAEAAASNANVTASRNRERDRMLQYPRAQPAEKP